jgi:nicotinamidase-related amidase
MLIQRQKSLLLVVDLQEKLAPAIFEGERAIRNSVRLLEGARRLGIPAFVSEQYVRGLGPSVEAIRQAAIVENEAGPAVNAKFFEKTHFSCTADPGVTDLLRAARRPQVIVTGTETHVCVLQSALGLLAAGFSVFLVADAASSRRPTDHEAGVERLRAAGVQVVTTEMVLFEWLEAACTDEFRAMLPLIR